MSNWAKAWVVMLAWWLLLISAFEAWGLWPGLFVFSLCIIAAMMWPSP